MTATPIDREYLFDELKDLPIINVRWNEPKVNV